MDARSEAQLATVMPELADKVRAAATQLAKEGTYLLVVSGLRLACEQTALYSQGRTTPGHIVTNAPAGLSMHNYGLAVDVVPYLTQNAQGYMNGSGLQLNWNPNTPQYQEMVSALKKQGLTFGGDWVHFPDMDHFQLGGLPANPSAEMIADYGSGDSFTFLEEIWANVMAGKYTVTA